MIRNKDLVFVRLNDTNAQQKLFGYEHTHTNTERENVMNYTHTYTNTRTHQHGIRQTYSYIYRNGTTSKVHKQTFS